MTARTSKSIVWMLCGIALSWHGSAEMVLPGYLTDPTAMKEVIAKDAGYQPPERLKYPYVSTYYVKPTVTPEETVKLAKKPMADRMITRAINHLWSSLKICFLKRAIDG